MLIWASHLLVTKSVQVESVSVNLAETTEFTFTNPVVSVRKIL